MGTNLFLEGFPSPVVIHVKLSRSVNTFSELNEVTFALKEIDRFLYAQWHQKWPSFKRRRNRDILLLNFRLSSPPEFSILSDPAWLAVLFTFLAGYKGIKSNVREILNDFGRLISCIRGLTDRELQLLEIAVRLTLEGLFEKEEQAAFALYKKFHRIGQKLIGDSEEPPQIIVKDIEKDKYW